MPAIPPAGRSYWSLELFDSGGTLRRFGAVAYSHAGAIAAAKSAYPTGQVVKLIWLGVVDAIEQPPPPGS